MNHYELLVAFFTIARKEVNRFLRIWTQTFLPSAITMTLYFTIFGGFIGSQLPSIQSFSYMQFIAPGLMMIAIVTNAYMNVSASFFILKFQKSLDEILVSPMPASIVILGYAAGGALRGALNGTIVLLIASLFSKIPIHNLLCVIIFTFLTSMVFALAGLANGILARKFDDINIVPTFVLTPLSYLGGVFYSTDHLTGIWQKIAYFNPVLYMVNGLRFGLLGISDVSVPLSICFLLALNLGFYFLAHRLYTKGLGLKA